MSKLNIFKKIISFITCSAVSLGLILAYPAVKGNRINTASAKTINELHEERAENDAQIAEFEAQLAQLESDKASNQQYQETLVAQINLIKENIASLDLEIDKLNNDILDAQNNINDLNNTINEKQDNIDKNIELFKKRLCEMYISGNDNLASVILGASDFYDIMSQMEMANRMAEYDEKLIDDILGDIDELENDKKTIETEKLTLEMKNNELQSKKEERIKEINSVNEKMAKTQEVLDNLAREEERLKNDKRTLDQRNADLEAEEAEIRAEYERLEKERIRKQQEEAAAAANNNQSFVPSVQPGTIIPSDVDSSGYAWPCPGFYYISSYFGYRPDPFGSGSTCYHSGWDIGDYGIAGAPVVASKSGTVVEMYNSCPHNNYGSCGCGGGYGNHVILQHPDGSMTVYGHLTSACVSYGQSVSQGETIGYVGSTGQATGPHLHFEVRIGGQRVDPKPYIGHYIGQ